jgi:hypothetical protein
VAITVWNQMGGTVEWSALPVLCELHGVGDVELLVAWLVAIREGMKDAHGE